MQLKADDLHLLTQQAIDAAQKAGDYIRNFDRTLLNTQFKSAGSSQSSQVVTQVDFACQEIILAILQSSIEQYDLAVLSEENSSEESIHLHPRLYKDYFWCIDPLDGTLPFIEGAAGYAVSIALVSKTGAPVIGIICNPLSGNTYSALVGGAGEEQAYKNGQLITSRVSTGNINKEFLHNQRRFILYCDRSFASHQHYPLLIKQLSELADKLGYAHFDINSQYGAVINALSVIEMGNKDAACYIKLPKNQAGGGSLWDFSATACLANATNTWVSDIQGQPLDLNRQDSNYMNHKGVLYASDSVLAEHIINLCSELV